MKLTIERAVTETTTDWPLLECKLDSGNFITEDPFIYSVLKCSDQEDNMTWKEYVKTLIGRQFDMAHYHVSSVDVYYPEVFDEVEL